MTVSPSRHTVVRLILPLGLLILVVGLYTSSLDNYHFLLDDFQLIVDHPSVTKPGQWAHLWVHGVRSNQPPHETIYQPITTLSYRINAMATGLLPMGFRLVNIAALATLGCLLATWLNQYTKHYAGPWLAAALFVAHPVNAEAINHLAERAYLLSMIGVVAFLILQRRVLDWTRQCSTDEDRLSWKRFLITLAVLLGGILSAMMAFFSSTVGLILVPLALTQAWLTNYTGSWRGATPNASACCQMTRWMVHGTTLVCLAAPAWLWWIGHGLAEEVATLQDSVGPPQASVDMTVNPLLPLGFGQRIPAALSLAWFYTQQVVWPNPRFNHTPSQIPAWAEVSTVMGLLVLIVMVAAALATLPRRRWYAMASAMAISQYALVCQLWAPSERYASNAFAMPFVLAGAVCLAWAVDHVTRQSTRKRAIVVIPCSLVILVMAFEVHQVNGRWFSKPRLLAWDVANDPNNPVSMYLYGDALLEAGPASYLSAEYWLENAIEQRPASIQCRYKLAVLEELLLEPAIAKDHYQQILRQQPNHPFAHVRLAALSIADEEFDTAQHHLQQANKVNPHDRDVMYYLAKLAHLRGNLATAQLRYQSLLKRYPDHTRAQRDYARLMKIHPTTGAQTDP